MQNLTIAITPGEPAGIGPELILALAQSPHPYQLVVFADPELLAARAQQLHLPIKLHAWQAGNMAQASQAGVIFYVPTALATPSDSGQLNPDNSAYVLACISKAVKACLQGQCQALVTGPVHKGVINQAGIAFNGHTDFIADLCDVKQVVMMLATPGLRVALATTHIPLSQVPKAINRVLLRSVIEVLNLGLIQHYGKAEPKILVCGLNPHSGEGGHLGREEIEIIQPVIEQLRHKGLNLTGPVAADTAFTQQSLLGVDVVLTMYHDQGLPVLKALGFGYAINVTLGLPIIRTSVDHGTALTLAGSGKANIGSLQAALAEAVLLASA